MAGLLAARVLTDTCDVVTIVERDTLAAGPHHRRGVPQGQHTHGLLASGRRALETLFPDIGRELVEHGALETDIVRDARWFFEGACLQRFDSGLRGLLMTRPLLESVVRARIAAHPRVRVRDGAAVDGLVAGVRGDRVTGVKIGGRTLEADLVVDATGRGSRSPAWLESLGYERPAEESVQIALGCAFPPAFSSSATPSAASIRSTARACRWRRCRRSSCSGRWRPASGTSRSGSSLARRRWSTSRGASPSATTCACRKRLDRAMPASRS